MTEHRVIHTKIALIGVQHVADGDQVVVGEATVPKLGADELEAYQALYGFAAVMREHLQAGGDR